MNLLNALARWRALKNPAPRTFDGYRHQLNAMVARGFADSMDVTAPRIADWITTRALCVKPQTVNQGLCAVYAALGALAMTGEFAAEDLSRLKKLRIRIKPPRRFTAKYLDRAHHERLLARARELEPRLVLPLQVACLAGLRAGELCRLRWEDINLGPEPFIRVRLALELGQHGRIKTGSERLVPVCQELAQLLAPVAQKDGFLFESRCPSGSGRRPRTPFITVKTLSHELRRIRGEELDWVTWQVTRHTRASWWVQAGAPLAKVSHWLGHANQEVTERFYAALRDGYDPDCERMPAA